MTTTRAVRRRRRGWRMPEGGVYVGRPSPYGNPFPIDGERSGWFALALGHTADAAGRRAAALRAHRHWLAGGQWPELIPGEDELPDAGGSVEYTSGQVRKISSIPVGMGVFMLAAGQPFTVPAVPDISGLADKVLVCWCELDQPCHADAYIEMLDRGLTT